MGFRNYSKRKFTFEKTTTLLVGANAVGKTNVLEAIYLLATGDSFRADKIEEMVGWEGEVAHIVGEMTNDQLAMVNEDPKFKLQMTNNNEQNGNNQNNTELQVTLTRGEVQGKKVRKRLYKVNGVGRRKQDFVGKLLAVAFRPEDLQLMDGSPGRRRRFLDAILVQVDREYRRSLVSYENGLRRRNKLLDAIRDGEADRRTLTFWDQLVIKHGNELTDKRRELIEYMNGTKQLGELVLRVVYDTSTISEERLRMYEREEVAAGYTLVGPHRDDFKIVTQMANNLSKSRAGLRRQTKVERNLAMYGSRGEQRMAVLWLKLGELQFIELKTKEWPLLLLDDIFSELDGGHDQMVMGLLGQQQTVITTTDEDGRLEGSGVQVEHLT